MSKSLPLLLLGSTIVLSPSVAVTQAQPAKVPTVNVSNTQIPNVAGTWKVILSEAGRTATYVFNQKGNALTGTMKGLPFGDLPIAGTITPDGKLSFSGKMSGMKFSFAGTVTGQTMQGIADLPIGRKNWTATK